jgi:phosphoadenosine phosphosulfate reductase
MSAAQQINEELLAELDQFDDPYVLIREILNRFGRRAGIGTGGQLTGCALISMAADTELPFRVFTIDTHKLHPETYQLFNRLEERYGIYIERVQPDAAGVAQMVRQHGDFLFYDSKEKQEYCCNVRKVEPNERVLKTLDVWITGLRRDQSEHRRNAPKLSIIEENGRPVLKACPLIEWTEADVRDYIERKRIPYNTLFDINSHGIRYTSIGCVCCTTAVLPHEDPRAGRWRWFNILDNHKKECGLHM